MTKGHFTYKEGGRKRVDIKNEEKVLRRIGQAFSESRNAPNIFAMCPGNSAFRFATLLHESKIAG